MPNKTHRALPRYKISDFFRSLLENETHRRATSFLPNALASLSVPQIVEVILSHRRQSVWNWGIIYREPNAKSKIMIDLRWCSSIELYKCVLSCRQWVEHF